MCTSRFPLLALAVAIALAALAAPVPAQDADRDRAFDEHFRRGIELLERKEYDRAVDAFQACIALRKDLPEPYYNVACAYSLKGEKEKAIEWLAEALARGFREEAHIAQDRDLDPIRDEPAFRALMAKTFFGKGDASGGALPGGEGKLLTLSGEPVSLERLKGKVVIFELWRTWAEPCRQQAAILAELNAELGPKGLAIVAISDEPGGEQERVADDLKINYLLLRNEGPLPAPLFEGVREVYPTFLIVDREGRLAKRLIGARTKEELRDAVLPLLEPAKGKRQLF